MNKITKSAIILGLALTMVTPVFATKPVNTIVTQPEVSKPTKKYVSKTAIVDTYGNYVSVDTQWQGSSYHFVEQGDKESKDFRTVKFTRNGYQAGSFKQSYPQTQNIAIKPSKVTQVTMGQLVIPENLPKDNWWISLTKPGAHSEDVVIKVKPDGTFKFVNLQNGTYNVEVFRGTHEDSFLNGARGCMWDKTNVNKLGDIEVKGNVNKVIDISKSTVDALSVDEYFKDSGINYSNPSKYIAQSPLLELDAKTKQEIDKLTDGKSGLELVKSVLGYIESNFMPKTASNKTDLQLPVAEIIKQGHGTGCTQFATLYQALASYKNLPTVVVNAVDVNWAKEVQEQNRKSPDSAPSRVSGHIFVETYVDGDWILVDPTAIEIYTSYDKLNDKTFNNNSKDSLHFYTMAKTPVIYGMDDSINRYSSIYFAKTANLSLLKDVEFKSADIKASEIN